MEFYIFRHSEWNELYNCSYDISTISIEQRVHKMHGILMITLALLFLLIYISPLYVIMRNCLHKTAYQIMLIIGISDLLMLTIFAIPFGIMSLTGHVFCSHPTYSYISGCLAMSLWILSTESSIILSIYRCLELWRPQIADILFKGKYTFIWIGFSLCHSTAAFFFGLPIAYNSLYGTLLLNPHAGYIEDTEGKFFNFHHVIYDWGLLLVIIGLYVAFVFIILSKQKQMSCGPSRELLAIQKKALIQALIISSCGAVSDAYWAFVFLGPSPPQIVIFIGMYTWICSHGGPGIIYIIMNKTIRSSILKFFKKNTVSSYSISRNVDSIKRQDT